LIRQKLELVKENKHVLQSPGSFSPVLLTKNVEKKILKIAQRICDVFKLDNVPLLIQALINKEEVNVIEFAPRIGGGLSYRTIFLNTGFDILNASVESFLGNHVEVKYSSPKNILATIIIYAFPGFFYHVDGIDSLIADGTIVEFHHYKTPGMIIGDDMSTRSRIGAFIVKAESKAEINTKIDIALKKINVYDINNQSIMRHDIYKMLKNDCFTII